MLFHFLRRFYTVTKFHCAFSRLGFLIQRDQREREREIVDYIIRKNPLAANKFIIISSLSIRCQFRCRQETVKVFQNSRFLVVRQLLTIQRSNISTRFVCSEIPSSYFQSSARRLKKKRFLDTKSLIATGKILVSHLLKNSQEFPTDTEKFDEKFSCNVRTRRDEIKFLECSNDRLGGGDLFDEERSVIKSNIGTVGRSQAAGNSW